MKRIGFGELCLQPILVERTLAEVAGRSLSPMMLLPAGKARFCYRTGPTICTKALPFFVCIVQHRHISDGAQNLAVSGAGVS